MSPHHRLPLKRLSLPFNRAPADANIRFGHPAEAAAWIWTENWHPGEHSILRWTRAFELREARSLVFHVSADQRYQLYVDGDFVGCGPDAGDIDHWMVASYHWEATEGAHLIEVLSWWLPPRDLQSEGPGTVCPPMSHHTFRPGFLFHAEGEMENLLSTGKAEWHATDLSKAVSLQAPMVPGYHVIGPEFSFSLEPWEKGNPAEVMTVFFPLRETDVGIRRPGWALFPSSLPTQKMQSVRKGVMRALRCPISEREWHESDTTDARIEPWSSALRQGMPLDVPAQTEVEFVWDFEDYLCGYPDLEVAAGLGSEISIAWAESLFETTFDGSVNLETPKGNRSQVAGKLWCGMSDYWQLTSSKQFNRLPALWWRSGRYLRCRLKTRQEPLTIRRFAVRETGYPLNLEASWHSSDSHWDRLLPFLWKGLTINAHETWCDCPYYEQLNYLGDTVLHALSNYTGSSDDRLSRSSLRNFDWSRVNNGWVAERYPSRLRQECPTYSMLFPCMLRDFLLWRGDKVFVCERLAGMRGSLEPVLEVLGADNLPTRMPGWPFVDWAPEWDNGCPPGIRQGNSVFLALHAVRAFEAAAQVEHHVGEELMARRYHSFAERIMKAAVHAFWSDEVGGFADTSEKSSFSEQAQAFAVLCEALDSKKRNACLELLCSTKSPRLLTAATVYFNFYILEAFALGGRAEPFFKRLAWWRSLQEVGFHALPEAPEPSRSDAHGWGAHPFFHTFASIAGIRPTSPGMATLQIRPMPGDLKHFHANCPHPQGRIDFAFRQTDTSIQFELSLPNSVTASLIWKGLVYECSGEAFSLTLPVG